jgi:hypothetical protein
MAAELEKLMKMDMNLDTVQFGELSPGGAPKVLKRVVDGARPESGMQTLSLVLESLWLFYEAMRSGKPLACGDERLAQIQEALKGPSKKKQLSARSEPRHGARWHIERL